MDSITAAFWIPRMHGTTAIGAPACSAIAAFPINPKRFMVPTGFVIGKCRLSTDIKGLAVGLAFGGWLDAVYFDPGGGPGLGFL
jgi:hypothetical protein